MNYIATQNYNRRPICTCPHCNSTSLTRSGFDRGTQRYRCKSCQKTFKATASTPVHGLHKKEKIEKYLKALHKGMSIRKAAEYVGISNTTSFAWRHKFLSSLKTHSTINTTSETSATGIIQLKYSAKGRRPPPEKHTVPTSTIILLTDGQLELHKLSPVKHSHHATLVYSKSSARFFAAAPHKTITAAINHSERAIKIKNQQISRPMINEAKQQTAKLLIWMERFKGVASKYLQNYWNWYASLLNLSQLKQETEHFYKACKNNRSLAEYFDTKNI